MLALQSLSSWGRHPPLKDAALTKSRKELAGRGSGEACWNPASSTEALTRGWGMCGLKKLLTNEKGASAIEYALVATLISIAAIAAFNNLGNKIDTMYNNVGNAM